jgi:septation ring formation regulator
MSQITLIGKAGIITLSVLGGVALVGLFVLLYFTVFMHARLKRQVHDLTTRFERNHGLLFGQDSQFIKRLETISSMNLTYVQEYMDWNKKFKDIRDVSDASAQAAVNGTKDLLAARRYSDLKEQFPLAKKVIDNYESQVTSLDGALKRKFQDEEDCRTLTFDEREKLRKIKQDYFSRQADLGLVGPSFEAIFAKLDSLFDSVEQNIENAQYLDAKTILINQISPVNDSIAVALKSLPNICISIQSVIPDKLTSLQNRYDEMIKGGYPLYHILLPDDFAGLNDELATLAKRVQNFDLKGVEGQLDDMTRRVDGYGVRFDDEKTARTTFESECDGVYAKEKDLEKNFIDLCNALPAVKKIYLLSGEQSQIDAIQITINKAGASRRSLDAYIHSATKQPYSLLVERMKALSAQGSEAASQIVAFQNYLSSLKTDSEKANSSLSVYWSRLKSAEKTLREINLKPVYDRFESVIDSLYSLLDTLSVDLRTLPIDVKKVDADLQELTSKADETVSSLEQCRTDSAAAEQAIVYGNRFRSSSGEINSLMVQAEGLFYAADFAKAKETADEAVSRVQEGR